MDDPLYIKQNKTENKKMTESDYLKILQTEGFKTKFGESSEKTNRIHLKKK
ncbi:hypothetical protein [Helicobacter sp. 12S02232-10]|uniref:hypothetical protein n=1 Tax=Helicobacter sp. 12S02232-10 TaxID=1476197 RepID=UPI0015DE0C2B|nr:hypothetical protein [Helicobacter sp. 12S02232-10]